jgi:hypothetical protein
MSRGQFRMSLTARLHVAIGNIALCGSGVLVSLSSKRAVQVWGYYSGCEIAPEPTGHGHELPRAAMNSRGERYPSALCG